MSNSRDRSLVRIYKDLLVSKRELTDLRQSVNKTFKGLNKPYKKFPSPAEPRPTMCYNCGVFCQAAAPHECRPPTHKCQDCFQFFPNGDELRKHRDANHHQCRRCYVKHREDPELHYLHFCGETRVPCENCGAKIQRKSIHEHVLACCFHECFKCGKGIYYKGYAHHLTECRPHKVDSVPAKKTNKKSHTVHASKYLPVSLRV